MSEQRAARSAAASSDGDVSTALARLSDLHDRGELTDEEYTTAKARVLGSE